MTQSKELTFSLEPAEIFTDLNEIQKCIEITLMEVGWLQPMSVVCRDVAACLQPDRDAYAHGH